MITHLQITFPQHPGQAFPVAASNGQTLPTRARSDVRKGKGYPIRLLTRAEWDDQNRPAGPYLAAYQPKRPVPDVDFEAEDGSLWPTAEACLEHELEVRFGVKTLAEVDDRMKALADKAKLTVGQIQDAFGNTTPTIGFIVGQEAMRGGYGIMQQPANDALYDKNGNPPFSGVPEADDDYHAMMNGPRIAQSLPPEYLERILQVAKEAESQVSEPTLDEAARLLASAVSQRGLKVADAAKATGLTPAQVKATAASLPGQFATKGGRVFLIN